MVHISASSSRDYRRYLTATQALHHKHCCSELCETPPVFLMTRVSESPSIYDTTAQDMESSSEDYQMDEESEKQK
jgi:hypothetical protein